MKDDYLSSLHTGFQCCQKSLFTNSWPVGGVSSQNLELVHNFIPDYVRP